MNDLKKCLFCYKSLESNQIDFHDNCSKNIFSTLQPLKINFDITELTLQNISKRVSVTGVQSKLSLDLRNISPRQTITDLLGNYIIKLASEEYEELPENEDLTMHLAEKTGIHTARHSFIRLYTGELAYITKRFDRNNGEKISVEDFCQLTEKLTEQKYRGSIEQIGKTAFKFTSNKGFEMQRLFELVLFSYLVGNADMHLKNFSLIENKFNEYEFSPAYDLLNTMILNPSDREETALTINGKKNRLQRKDFDTLAITIKIPEKTKNSIYKVIRHC